MITEIPCTIMRGGTSKGVFFLESDLPEDYESRNKIILRSLGSPDPTGRQLDGLGGATSTTSKIAIISKRHGEINTVNYTFGQVDIHSPLIDMKGNCGNISSAVGPFSVDMGLLDNVEEPITKVKIFNTNTNKYILAHVPTKDGKTIYEGEYNIPGVPTNGSPIKMDFMEPGGSVTGLLLPTAKEKEIIETDSFGPYVVSIVDAANPCVFVRASDLGLTGQELPIDVDNNEELLRKILEIRGAAAVKLGFAENIPDAMKYVPAVPKFCFVSSSCDYTTTAGHTIPKNEIGIAARMMSMGKLHPSYAITGGICLAVAAQIKGTLVNELCSEKREGTKVIKIGHCSGVMEVGASVTKVNGKWHADYGQVFRTARRLMSGNVYL
jgi:2-methylaconitate cis-trans-isomerase PrpF